MKSLNRLLHFPGLGLIALAYIAFIALGMPDGLLGVAWPAIRSGFGIPLDAMGWLLVTATTGYLISSFTSGQLVSRLGIGRILTISCALTGIALIGYTLVTQWWMLVLLGMAAGLGAGAIDAGLNTYVAANFNAAMMQWLHASYAIGVTLGPLIMTYSLVNLNTWRIGYRIVGGFQLVLALCFLLTLPIWSNKPGQAEQEEKKRITDYQTPLLETLKQPQVCLSIALFFFYVGAEVSLGAWAYTLLTESRGIPAQTAGFLTGSYWATFTIGRIFAGIYAKKVGVNKIVVIGAVGALVGSLLLWWNPSDWVNLASIAVIGFSIAPLFPALTTGTSHRVKPEYMANTIGMQMAASGLSMAIIPGMVGVFARNISLEIIPAGLAVLFIILLGLYFLAMKKPLIINK